MEQRARVIAENAGGRLIKLHHTVVGLPDRLLVMPQQRMTFIEFKARDEEPSLIQSYWHRTLGCMGHPVLVIRYIEEFRALVDSVNRS